MKKLILSSVVVTSYMFAGIHGEIDDPTNQSNVKQYNWVADTSDDDNKLEGRRRGGKGNKGRRRGGNGLR